MFETHLRDVSIWVKTKDFWAIHGREGLNVLLILIQSFAYWDFISSVETKCALKHLFTEPHLCKIKKRLIREIKTLDNFAISYRDFNLAFIFFSLLEKLEL